MMSDRFNKEEAVTMLECLDELFEAVPKGKRGAYLGHLNDLALFIRAAGEAAPEKPKKGGS